MKYTILVLSILVCFSARANAAVTANEYRENCHQYLDNKDSGQAGLCLGYAAGFMDGVSGAKFTSKGTVYTVSFREGVTAKQVLLAVVAYIDKHPEILHKTNLERFYRRPHGEQVTRGKARQGSSLSAGAIEAPAM